MGNLPFYINVVFGLTTILTVLIFVKASNNSIATLVILLAWLGGQAALGLSGFYTLTKGFPPRFILLGLPALVCILVLFATAKGRKYIDSLNIRGLTILHIVRIPVEIVLYWLFLYKAVPKIMTFEGRNFDILAGLTVPLVFYLAFIKKRVGRGLLLAWNFICICLLLNIVVLAILSAPFPFQQLAFDQPNIAVLYFPFVWLPCCVVPLVLFSHLASIRHLFKRKE